MLKITHHSGKAVAINYEQVLAIESDEQGRALVYLAGMPAYQAQETAAELEAAMDEWYATPDKPDAPKLITGPTEGKKK